MNTISIIINILQAGLIIFLISPIFIRKFNYTKLIEFEDLADIKYKIESIGKEMLSSKVSYMSFTDEQNLYVRLAHLKSKLKSKKQSYTYFNFPRAWLMIGLLENVSSDDTSLNQIDAQIDHLIDVDGNLKFTFDKIDQVLFGLLFIRRFHITPNQKYVNAADTIYKHIDAFINDRGEILYRKGDNILFVDTLGMVLPFLYEYGSLKNDTKIIDMADYQINRYNHFALDTENGLPCHAFDIKNDLKIGSLNWTRGLAWYLIGLNYAIKYSSEQEKIKFSIINNAIEKKLDSLSINYFWPQFFGHTNNQSIDASATIMIYYARSINQSIDIAKLSKALNKSIDEKGFVINNSGDTIYINNYARQTGKSEMSQGLLMSILNKKDK